MTRMCRLDRGGTWSHDTATTRPDGETPGELLNAPGNTGGWGVSKATWARSCQLSVCICHSCIQFRSRNLANWTQAPTIPITTNPRHHPVRVHIAIVLSFTLPRHDSDHACSVLDHLLSCSSTYLVISAPICNRLGPRHRSLLHYFWFVRPAADSDQGAGTAFSSGRTTEECAS